MNRRPNGHASAGITDEAKLFVPIPMPMQTKATQWLYREIPAPDRLMGDVFSTTSRTLLIGPSGIGKTNFMMALAYAMANGNDFLRWRSWRPARVAYIDGEMSQALMKGRITDADRRAAGTPEGLDIVCFDDMPQRPPPLSTPEGQAYLDRVLDHLETPEFVILDNVQALLAGEMQSEEPWAATLPWVHSLTKRKIGQLWVHHTGHDETRSYGTKTREWQMENVIMLDRVERSADVAFKMKFTKARERAPHNREDFDPLVVTLERDRWLFEAEEQPRSKSRAAAKPPRAKSPSPLGAIFQNALHDALAHAGEPRQESAGLPSVTSAEWESELARLGLLPEGAEKRERNKRSALISKYRAELIAANWAAVNAGFIWSIKGI